MLLRTMAEALPSRTSAHRTLVSPGPADTGEIAGDIPRQVHRRSGNPLRIPHYQKATPC